MRAIKFRAWDKDESIMTYLDLGNKNPDVSRLHIALLSDHLREPWGEVMQFTGLHDKNGKEIYEGDILCVDTGKSFVKCGIEWNNESACYDWYVSSYSKKLNSSLCHAIEEAIDKSGKHLQELWEVIGNIYENPELIAGTQKAPDLEGLKNCK